MSLSTDLISQFVKATKPTEPKNRQTTVYGTVRRDDPNVVRVLLDGSDISTPAITTADVKDGERVTVLIHDHKAVITGNIDSPAARSGDLSDVNDKVIVVETLVAGKASIEELEAIRATIDELDVKVFRGKYATIENLNATNAKITNLQADKLDANTAAITYATIAELNAAKGVIDTLQSDVASIDTLIFGSASGNTTQTSFSNSVIAQLGDAQIKSAMIDSVSASKIAAGDIITNNVRVKSQNGLLLIADETIQINDANRTRVQIGKDASSDYSINIWDASGNLMFSKGGITDSAIKQAIIRNDMVSDTANIAAHKLDIDSLFDEINDSTKTIKSTRVYLDEQKQTLDISFKALTSNVGNLSETVSSQGTAISVIQGQISSKIWQQDIDTVSNEMSTQYSTLSQELDSVSATVASHTTQISKKADGTTVTAVTNRVSTLETSLSGFKSTVSDTYATKSALNTTNSNVSNLTTRVSSAETSITQLSNKITANVTETTNLGTRMSTVEQTASGLTARLDNQVIGGTNILRGTNSMTELGSSAPWPSGGWRSAGSGTGERKVIDITDAPNADIKKGFSVTANSDDCQVSQDGVVVVEGATYTMSCYARGTGNLVLRIGRSPYDSKYIALSGETAWKKYSYTVTAGLGASGNGNALVNSKTNVYFGNNGVGTVEICGFKMEVGNVATDWQPSPFDFEDGISSASKTATDYLSFSSSGLVVGDMTASTLGNNVLIDSDSVDIRKGTTTMASFGASYLYLAKNSRNATIDLCNGLAKLYHQSRLSYDTLFVIETPNATEIRGTSDPLCVTATVATKPAIKFANSSGVLGSIGMIASGSSAYITRNVPSTAATYTILDTGNFHSVMDSGWVNCTLNTGSFTRYSNDIPQPQVRKVGKQVYLRGEAKPSVAVTPENDHDAIIATIPSGYRPAERQQFIMQGSGSYRWLMSIHTNGEIAISRYSNTTTANMNIAAGAWLCCHAQWLID